MLCQRCGHCCFSMDVPIMVDGQDGLKIAWKPAPKACPHLSFEGPLACCAVHDRPEYKGSPCWIYGNSQVDPDFISKRGRPCPIGKMWLQQGGYLTARPEAAEPTSPDELEVLGSWDSSYPLEG